MQHVDKLIAILYFAFWILFAVGLVFLGTSLGYPLWLMIVIAYLVTHVGNGSLAHYALSRRLRSQNKEPPSYFEFLFRTKSFRISELTKPIRAPILLRVFLGIVALLMAVLLLAGGSVVVLIHERSVHLFVGAFLFVLGIVCIWLGHRFLKKEGTD
jgi:small basic protein